ncbi:hypothetical protein [Lysobacter auxotrophicus]|uniref:Uncharacterized protein n=1 Tax=Lysobacter auxotrophicus TaxID=2992573 RepID=A0ABM8DIC9_9GAMM|nr:hypothetical protein [Lysobacter auxotrophicus]BDU18401.1 hypothetical protein LA521A_36020 [Lysobacter auxotrophicus]
MNKQPRWGWLLALGIACSSFAALAQDDAAAPPQKLDRILAQQQELKRDLDAGKTDGMTTRQVNAIRKAQVDVFAVTDGKTSLDQLSMDEKVRLENALERINAEVKNTRAGQDEKQVCWRERTSGTTMKVTRCGTEAEKREAREGARDFLDRPKVCGDRCG